AVEHVPIATNDKTRESRLFHSMWSYIGRNMIAIFRIYTGYEPLRVFSILAALLAIGALAAWSPFLWDWIANGDRSGHLQSIILGGVLTMAAIQVFALGVLADSIASHRTVSQRTLERVRRIELQLGIPPSHYVGGPRGSVAGDEGEVAPPGGDDGPVAAPPERASTGHGA